MECEESRGWAETAIVGGLGEVHDGGLGSGGDLIRQGLAARVGRVVHHPEHGELDDLVDGFG
jgi:hypothetical protein